MGEKVNFEDVFFGKSVGEVTFVAPVMFGRGADIPTDLTVGTEGSTSVGGKVGDNLGAGRGNGSAVEVVVTEEGGVGRERRMNTGGAEEVQSQDRLWEETVPFGEGES